MNNVNNQRKTKRDKGDDVIKNKITESIESFTICNCLNQARMINPLTTPEINSPMPKQRMFVSYCANLKPSIISQTKVAAASRKKSKILFNFTWLFVRIIFADDRVELFRRRRIPMLGRGENRAARSAFERVRCRFRGDAFDGFL